MPVFLRLNRDPALPRENSLMPPPGQSRKRRMRSAARSSVSSLLQKAKRT